MVRKTTKSISGTRSPKKQSAGNPETKPVAGGEVHQIAGGQHPALTTNQGVALSDNQNSLKANPRGPVLLEDLAVNDHSNTGWAISHVRRENNTEANSLASSAARNAEKPANVHI